LNYIFSIDVKFIIAVTFLNYKKKLV